MSVQFGPSLEDKNVKSTLSLYHNLTVNLNGYPMFQEPCL
jgi:hypothetical protein